MCVCKILLLESKCHSKTVEKTCDNLSKVNITFFIKIGTKQKSTYLRCNFLDDYIRKKNYVHLKKKFKNGVLPFEDP